MTEHREYHPDLPDHPLIWIGARVAMSSGYGGRDVWRFATVDRYTATQVVLKVDGQTYQNGEDRWTVKSLAPNTRYQEKWPTFWKHGSQGGASTCMARPDDPSCLGSKIRGTVRNARAKVDELLNVQSPHKHGYKVPIEDYRKGLVGALAALAAAKERFEQLVERLPDDHNGEV